jgi:hypothetical protein
MSFITNSSFAVKGCYPHVQPSRWRTAPFNLSAAAYSIYSQLSIAGGHSSKRNLRMHHAVVTGTNLTWLNMYHNPHLESGCSGRFASPFLDSGIKTTTISRQYPVPQTWLKPVWCGCFIWVIYIYIYIYIYTHTYISSNIILKQSCYMTDTSKTNHNPANLLIFITLHSLTTDHSAHL